MSIQVKQDLIDANRRVASLQSTAAHNLTEYKAALSSLITSVDAAIPNGDASQHDRSTLIAQANGAKAWLQSFIDTWVIPT